MTAIKVAVPDMSMDALLQVSVNYSFDPLKQTLLYIMQQLKANSDSVQSLKQKLSLDSLEEKETPEGISSLPATVISLKVLS